MTAAVARKGFSATVVADVISGAGVSRKTFYEHFKDRDGCFMPAYEDGLTELQSEMARAAADVEVRVEVEHVDQRLRELLIVAGILAARRIVAPAKRPAGGRRGKKAT